MTGIKSYSMGSGFQHGLGRESRAVTLQNGEYRILHIDSRALSIRRPLCTQPVVWSIGIAVAVMNLVTMQAAGL